MKRIKSSKTKLEKKFSKLIHLSNLKYRSQPKLFGKPDFRILEKKVLIFCDSSFWHGRRKREINGIAFSRNKQLWVDKLKYNKRRGSKVNEYLRKKGWIVLRFWDTDIYKNSNKIIRILKSI
jgi:DNA mismatch endonuclease (patch repair protein)